MASVRPHPQRLGLVEAHSVFTQRGAGNLHELCPQCPSNNRNASDQNHQENCHECNRSTSQRSRRSRRSSSTPDPLDSETITATQSSRRSRSSRSRSNRSSRQHRRRRRHNRSSRMTTDATVQAASSTQISNENNQNQVNVTRPMTPEEEAEKCQIRQWPHSLSFVFAALTCTLGMFSISRFAILTIDFGVTFILQFLLLSIFFGIPLFVFHVSLGQYLGSGVIDMWRISPIHQGIGVALMVAQGLYGVYNIAAISWLFVYFRDSFITTFDRYKWSFCYPNPKYGRQCQNSMYYNNTWKLEESIPDYYNGQVLLRSSPTYPQTFSGELRFQTLFHIIVIWMSVFIGLSKGLKSYGKVVYLFSISSLVGFTVFAIKVIGLLPLASFKHWVHNTHWLDLLYNGDSWICAARECFFTWCILGATLSQLASHNKFKHKLFRDTTIVILVTFLVLILSGICGITMVNIISHSGYQYQASSFETSESYEFLTKKYHRIPLRNGREFPLSHLSRPQLNNIWSDGYASEMTPRSPVGTEHISFLAGVRILREDRQAYKYSGYQVMRLATELVPAVSAIITPRLFSPFWVVIFYFTMIVMGLAQQMAIFHTVSSGLIAVKSDYFMQFESSLIFISCLLGLIFCFPLATEFGAFIVYFFDYTIGCGWWMMILYVMQLCAIFVVRGKPYSGEQVATVLITKANICASWLVPLLAFTWHVISPVGLIILSVVSFRWCRFSEMFDWTTHAGYLYMPAWVREIGAMMQLLPLLLVPFVGVVQSFRYFLNGHGPLHERINSLYRPSFETQANRSSNSRNNRRRHRRRNDGVVLTNYNSGDRFSPVNDPPPKYTPPPSYSTATGARIARFLRQSFRQSIRRFRGESVERQNSQASVSANVRGQRDRGKLELPPDYATVVIETERHSNNHQVASEYGSLNHSQDLATTSSMVSSELTLVEANLEVEVPKTIENQAETSFQASSAKNKRDSIQSQSFRYKNLKEDTESITISNAEPIDTLGASALVESDNFYSIPTPSTETDNALTEYTFVKEVRVEAPKNIQQEDDDNASNSTLQLATPSEIYSTASTLSLGETVILSDGWVNLPIGSAGTANSNQNQEQQSSEFVLTLDVDTSASVI